MFSVLRRFSILMTMIGEEWLLGRKASFEVKACIFAMIFGAIVAASDDLAFNLFGYVVILANDVFTAANGVYVKKKLDSKELGTFGLMFYNCLYCLVPIATVVAYEGKWDEIQEFDAWTDSTFLGLFLLSTVLGFVLTYSIFLCTQINSALTTTVVGCLKNVMISYGGMLMSDYIFSTINFVGLNISIVGSLFYAYITFAEKKKGGTLTRVASQRDALESSKAAESTRDGSREVDLERGDRPGSDSERPLPVTIKVTK